jgi:hypothetical protein
MLVPATRLGRYGALALSVIATTVTSIMLTARDHLRNADRSCISLHAAVTASAHSASLPAQLAGMHSGHQSSHRLLVTRDPMLSISSDSINPPSVETIGRRQVISEIAVGLWREFRDRQQKVIRVGRG